MNRTEALARLTLDVAPDQRPVLSPTDLDTILDGAAVPDRDGRLATDTTWVPSWDLDRAAAAAWRVKAARVAGDFNFTADGSGFSKGDVMAQCLRMADMFAARGMSVVTFGEDHLPGPYDSPRLLVN